MAEFKQSEITEERQRSLDIVAIVRKMPLSERKWLKDHFGIIIPIRLTQSSDERYWGYKCHACQGNALEFVGSKFSYSLERDGELVTVDRPPLGVPIEDLPWIQDVGPNARSRTCLDLRCQKCRQPVGLQPDRSLRAFQIVRVGAVAGTHKSMRFKKNR